MTLDLQLHYTEEKVNARRPQGSVAKLECRHKHTEAYCEVCDQKNEN